MTLVYLILFSSLSNADCTNKIAQSEVAAAIAQTPGAGAKVCGPDDPCVCFDGIDFSVASMMNVDDPSRPKYAKRQVTACANESECRTELAVLTCTDDGAVGLINADFTEVYCAVPNGFEQKQVLANDPAKIATRDAAQAAAQELETKRSIGRARREAGLRVIDAINGNNDAKNMTVEQTIQLNQTLAPIIGLLQSGSLKSAKTMIQGLTPQGIITQADIDLTLKLLAIEGY